eukprot:4344103-Alexandrium_andersonii.AAC.1
MDVSCCKQLVRTTRTCKNPGVASARASPFWRGVATMSARRPLVAYSYMERGSQPPNMEIWR